MPANRRSKRYAGSRITRGSRPYLPRSAKNATKGKLHGGSKRRQRTSLASKAKRATRLRTAVVANAKALDAVKEREFGYWQTTNSVLGGATEDEHMGNSYNDLTSTSPILIHLNNLHSCNGDIPPDPTTAGETTPLKPDINQGACHILRENKDGDHPVGQDGLVRDFERPEVFAVNGVLQKQKRSGPHMYPRYGYAGRPANDDVPMIPIPNGKKLRWGGVDLQFRVEGALQNTQIDFWLVKCNKEDPLKWDPWHQKMNSEYRNVPGTLPYTIRDFENLHEEMYPKKLDTSRYNVLLHRRVFVNNVHRVTGQDAHNHLLPDNAKYATGNTWSHTATDSGPFAMHPTHEATTASSQKLRISFKPNKIVRPLRNFIGERINNPVELQGTEADANPEEPATLGTMSWDNFHPSANVWLVVTTNHKKIVTPKVAGPYSYNSYEYDNIVVGQGGVTALPTWQGKTYNKEPTNYTSWRQDDNNHGYVGTDIREEQIARWHAALVAGLQAGQSLPPQWAKGGQFYQEWEKLYYERQDRDLYRNPRIHIFRRTWWQDEHIPTGPIPRLTQAQADMQIDTPPTQTLNQQQKQGISEQESESLKRKHEEDQIFFNNIRENPPDGLDTTTHPTDPSQWAAFAQGVTGYVAGYSISPNLQARIDAFKITAARMAFYGITRHVFTPLKNQRTQAYTPTAEMRMASAAARALFPQSA